MRKIEIIFEEMLPIIKEALSDHIDNNGNKVPKMNDTSKAFSFSKIHLSSKVLQFFGKT